ncbi:hypothetical protein ACM9HF_14515 [Colwellia sp. RE-S-Sl-9]
MIKTRLSLLTRLIVQSVSAETLTNDENIHERNIERIMLTDS